MPRILRSLWPLLALLAIAAAGCSKPEDAFVGHYTGKLVLSQKMLSQYGANASKVQAGLAKMTMTLDINKDKTFISNTDSGTGMKSQASGTWSVVNNQVLLSATNSTQNGKAVTIPPNQPPVKFNVSADKKSLSPDVSAIPGAAEQGTMTFTKS